MKLSVLIVMVAFVTASLHAGGVLAAERSSEMTSVNCATVKASMMKPAPQQMTPAMPAGASVDKMFAMEMHAMMEHATHVAKLEAKCGKDAKMRASAEKMIEDFQAYGAQLAIPPAY